MPVHHEQRSEPSGSLPVDVGVDVEPMPEQQDNAHGDEGMRERSLNTAQQPDGGSQNGSGRCGGVLSSRRNRLRRENPPPTRQAPPPAAARPSPAPGPNRRNHAFSAAAASACTDQLSLVSVRLVYQTYSSIFNFPVFNTIRLICMCGRRARAGAAG